MTIIYAKERALGPLLIFVVLRLWLHNVENDGYAILVVITHDTLVSVRAITSHKTVPFVGELGVLVVWQASLLASGICRWRLLTERDLIPDLVEVKIAAAHALRRQTKYFFQPITFFLWILCWNNCCAGS